MKFFLQEIYPSMVVIGGPGQGKSTLSQFLAQIHREYLLKKDNDLKAFPNINSERDEFIPKVPRIPFRIVLKYFAQWLADKPRLETVEVYLSEQIEKDSAQKVSPGDVYEIIRDHPTLIIFDGLDEVIEVDLRDKLMSRIAEFLRRLDQAKANVQILGTSRPTGYTGQFNPQEFWHLELQPMSADKALEYSKRWIGVKVQGDEE